MIKVIAEHSVDMDLLPYLYPVNILDLGCRGHEFCNAMNEEYMHTGKVLYGVDVDALSKPKYCLAISATNGYCGVERTDDPQATHIKEGNEIPMMTIPTFSKMVGVEHWDLIKMDIEGSEYKILETAQHPLATQVSVEFHEHTPRGIGKEALDKLLDHLEQWYTIHNRVWEERHGAGFNYWDILLIAK